MMAQMKSVKPKLRSVLLSLVVLWSGVSVLAQDGVLDLSDLANYANQTVPAYINRDNTPNGNDITDLGATLGRVLFYDKRLSFNDTISCASCHQQAHAFSDLDRASTGVAGTTGRHSMRLINARFADEQRFFWDERATSLEDQTTQPIQDHIEMGFSGTGGDPSFADLITKLSAIEEYQVLFAMVFGDAAITETRVQQSLAQFVRSIQSFDSKWDLGRAQVNDDVAPFPNFTAQENAGKDLFMRRPGPGVRSANCVVCHRAPEFDITPNSLSNGVVGAIGGGTDTTNTRSPSLRDIMKTDGTLNGELMHTGDFTLREVIDHYNTIPNPPPPNLDNRLRPRGQPQRLNLTETEKLNLEAFLRTLSGTSVYTDPRWSDPFDAQGNLSVITMPDGQLAITLLPDQTQADITARGVPGITYQLQQSADLETWTDTADVTANGSGALSTRITVDQERQFFRFVFQTSE